MVKCRIPVTEVNACAMKVLTISLPLKHNAGASEAVLVFEPGLSPGPSISTMTIKGRLSDRSRFLHFYARDKKGFSWGGPNQSVFGLIIDCPSPPDDGCAQVRVIDDQKVAEVQINVGVRHNRYVIKFPNDYNWIEIDGWAIPIP